MTPHIFLIAGPSGSGKTSLAQALVQSFPALSKVVTVTTRTPRPGEINGVDYHFVSVDRFAEMRVHELFVEVDYAYGEWYGTLYSSFMKKPTQTPTGFVEVVTVEGAKSLSVLLAGKFDVTTIFVLPPDSHTAAHRVLERNAANGNQRIAAYGPEVDLAYSDQFFDVILTNQVFEDALGDLSVLVRNSMRHLLPVRQTAQATALCLH